MKKTLLTPLLLLAGLAAMAQPQLNPNNIDEVLKAMTLEEKASLLVGTSSDNLVPGLAGGTRAIPRLGIPQTIFSDGPAGVRIDPERDPAHTVATGVPVGTLLASSWDTQLVENTLKVMGNEVLEYGVDVLLAPGMNIHRNPLCGRNFEYFSEDPLLSGKMAAAYIRGIQSNGVGTSAKHYAANNQETNRTENDALVSRRALREIYLKNFELAVKEGRPWTIMSSYNKLNGEYTQQDYELLTTILRDEWGYEGIVITDWGLKDNTAKSVKAGNDLMDPGSHVEIQRILEGVREGKISLEEVDRNVRRILEYVVKTPKFRHYAHSGHPDLKAHAVTSREAAAESIVLLRNQRHTLPLKGHERVALYGVTSEDFIAGGTGSGEVHKPYVVTMTQALETAGFTLDGSLKNYYSLEAKALKNRFKMEFEVDNEHREEPFLTASAIDYQATVNDVAVVVLGRQAGEGKDRKLAGDFELSATEKELLQNLHNAYRPRGKRVVVILNIGGVIETASWKHLADAILLPWSPGQEGANALADILTGKVNPSGKLPMSFPNNYRDIPSQADFPYDYEPLAPYHKKENVDFTQYTEDIWVGYRYYVTQEMEVSYPFGYGLSYTSFAYSKPTVKAGADGFTASVTITNTGDMAGKEVVELYVSAPAGGLEKPARELKAFAKTRLLQPGESQVLTMTVDNYGLASFNEAASAWEAAEGEYKLLFGASCTDIRATGSYRLKKVLSWPVNKILGMAHDHDARHFAALKDVAPAGKGLRYSYREGHHMSVDGFLSAPEKSVGITPLITATLKEREDHFGLFFKGLMKVEQDGLYRLSLHSDDGSRLSLDGQALINLDRDGGGSQEIWVSLEAGFHRLEVGFWDNFAEETIEVGLRGPGISVSNLPASMLYHE
ncbi:MAG: glycoside hydrolase family 3 C-terminal domain-containing protein [Bacteroidales bacterium]|nr:glycoside hydrolase family 3 C-terminal domain-containing protein [Bacteroidales bacterium]